MIEMENTFENDATSFFVSKRKLTGDEELPGATLTIQDKDGNVVRQWVSGDTPTEIRGLKFDTVYTLGGDRSAQRIRTGRKHALQVDTAQG